MGQQPATRKRALKILFVASEGVPFSKTGGLGDVVGALPRFLAARGHAVSVFLPRYRATPPGEVVHAGLTIPLGSDVHAVDIQQGPTRNDVRSFFVDSPPFFDRESLYMQDGKDYPDNPERFALFSKAALEFAHRDGFPDVIHCHDWQSGLIPVLLRTEKGNDPATDSVRVVLTIHNLGYQGTFPARARERIGLPDSLFTPDTLEFWGKLNFLKGGIVFADHLITVSKRYAQEIQTKEYGHGLEGVIRSRAGSLTGILNGVDYTEWNPETDRYLAANYSWEQPAGKQLCKKDLLEQFQLPISNLKTPVVGIVSRFVSQKGFDLIAEVADELAQQDLFIVALGTGEPEYEKLFRKLAGKYPSKCAVKVAYDNPLAHKIEAGSDIFLMPSRYEPCGLNQIYSLKYGSVPVVRATGGLDDTIESFDPATGQGTGFKFQEYSGEALLDSLSAALRLYRDHPRAWKQLVGNGMRKDYSWGASAAEYEALYRRLVENQQNEYNRRV